MSGSSVRDDMDKMYMSEYKNCLPAHQQAYSQTLLAVLYRFSTFPYKKLCIRFIVVIIIFKHNMWEVKACTIVFSHSTLLLFCFLPYCECTLDELCHASMHKRATDQQSEYCSLCTLHIYSAVFMGVEV